MKEIKNTVKDFLILLKVVFADNSLNLSSRLALFFSFIFLNETVTLKSDKKNWSIKFPLRFIKSLNGAMAKLLDNGCKIQWENDDVIVSYQQYSIRSSALDLSYLDTVSEAFIYDEYKLKKFSTLKDKIVLDIGSNIGDVAVSFASKGARVYCVEPLELLHPYLQNNITRNNMDSQITLFPIGLADTTQSLNIFVKNYGSACAGINSSTSDQNNSQLIPQELKLINADEFCDKYSISHAHIIKMDCEGAEYGIFENTQFIQRLKPEHIFIEYHNGPERLINVLNNLNYVSEIEPKTAAGDVGLIFASLSK